jgi:hypothetical protein
MSLDFFSTLRGTLEVRLSEPSHKIVERLHNRAAPSTASIVSVHLHASVFEGDDRRPLTEAELAQVVLTQPEIRMAGLGEVVVHRAPNGAAFTVRDLLAAVEETERRTRGQSEWFGGIDVHHCYFEGIDPDDDGVWRIFWGS